LVRSTFAAVFALVLVVAASACGDGKTTTHPNKKLLWVKVYFCTDQTCPQHGYATRKEIAAARAKLEANPLVGSVQFVSKSNPLPDALEVLAVKPEYTERIAQSLNPRPPGVQLVRYAAGG
jgi:hypothetical protein